QDIYWLEPQDAVNKAKGVSLMEKLIQRAKQSQKALMTPYEEED
ncbi:3287_t:CDS:2, partial [Dentiscutata erythropus]